MADPIREVPMPDGSTFTVPDGATNAQIRAFVRRKLQENFDVSGLSSAKFEAGVDSIMLRAQGLNPGIMKGPNKPAVDLGLTPDEQEARNRAANPSPSVGERMGNAMRKFVDPNEVPVKTMLNPAAAAAGLLMGKPPKMDPTIALRGAGAAIAAPIAGAAAGAEKMGLMNNADSRALERDMHGMLASTAGIPLHAPGPVPRAAPVAPTNRIARTAQAFKNVGVKPTAGQLTNSRGLSRLQNSAARLPGGASAAANRIESGAEAVKNRVTALADTMSPARTPETAGQTVKHGLEQFVNRFRSKAAEHYAKVDIPDNAPASLQHTMGALKGLNESIPGAPTVSNQLNLQGVKSLAEAIAKDAPDGNISYAALSRIRSAIGDKLASFDLTPDIPRAQLKQLYSALTEDMKAAAASHGKLAEFNRANRFYKKGIDRIDRVVEPLVKKDVPERIFKALESGTREGETAVRRTFATLKPEQRQAVGATILRRLGQAVPNAQNAEGTAFSAETFLTNWNKVSAGAKDALFGKSTALRKNLDEVAFVVGRMKDHGRVDFNPSGTSGATANTLGLGALGGSVATGDVNAIMGALGFLASGKALTGGLTGLGGAIKAGAATPAAVQRLMSSAHFTGWLARALKGGNYAKSAGALLQQAEKIGPQYLGDVQEFLQSVNEMKAGAQ